MGEGRGKEPTEKRRRKELVSFTEKETATGELQRETTTHLIMFVPQAPEDHHHLAVALVQPPHALVAPVLAVAAALEESAGVTAAVGGGGHGGGVGTDLVGISGGFSEGRVGWDEGGMRVG